MPLSAPFFLRRSKSRSDSTGSASGTYDDIDQHDTERTFLCKRLDKNDGLKTPDKEVVLEVSAEGFGILRKGSLMLLEQIPFESAHSWFSMDEDSQKFFCLRLQDRPGSTRRAFTFSCKRVKQLMSMIDDFAKEWKGQKQRQEQDLLDNHVPTSEELSKLYDIIATLDEQLRLDHIKRVLATKAVTAEIGRDIISRMVGSFDQIACAVFLAGRLVSMVDLTAMLQGMPEEDADSVCEQVREKSARSVRKQIEGAAAASGETVNISVESGSSSRSDTDPASDAPVMHVNASFAEHAKAFEAKLAASIGSDQSPQSPSVDAINSPPAAQAQARNEIDATADLLFDMGINTKQPLPPIGHRPSSLPPLSK